jgi:hypothetical protein
LALNFKIKKELFRESAKLAVKLILAITKIVVAFDMQETKQRTAPHKAGRE